MTIGVYEKQEPILAKSRGWPGAGNRAKPNNGAEQSSGAGMGAS